MSKHSRVAIFARVVLLPLALVLATVAGLGCYNEASDDAALAWLFSGVLALRPVASVPLYFHGFGQVLAVAYAAMPGVPWFGVLVGGLLSGATVLAFAVLDRLLRPWLRPLPLTLVLVSFFGVAWVEHWLWFSYVRVALLLAGMALLFAAQRPARRWALLLALASVGAAWLMRPSLAVLGFGAVLPAAFLLAGSWRRAAPLLLSVALLLALATGTAALLRTPTEAHTQARDGYFARILDFEQLQPAPTTTADSLGTSALSLWLMGDSTVVNEALGRRAYRFNVPEFWGHQLPVKIGSRARLLIRDYFPLLLALVATAFLAAIRSPNRKIWLWLVQLGFIGVLILFAGLLKLPPRLALPLLDVWLLTNLIYWLRAEAAADHFSADNPPEAAFGLLFPQLLRRLRPAVLVVVGLLYGAKTLHRRHVLGQERGRHEQALAEIAQRTGGTVRVLAGTSDLLKSLSPFRTYPVGAGPVLMLTGWPAHDPSQRALRQALAGSPDQTTCLRRLAAPGRQVRWLLSVETADWLNRRFRYQPGAGPVVQLVPGPALVADTTLRFYRPDFR